MAALEASARSHAARPASVGGVPGKWLGRGGAPLTLLYLHGGYFARSSRTHRLVTRAFAKAGLALMVRLRDLGLSLPARAALFLPWTDLAATDGSTRASTPRDAMFKGSGIAGAA